MALRCYGSKSFVIIQYSTKWSSCQNQCLQQNFMNILFEREDENYQQLKTGQNEEEKLLLECQIRLSRLSQEANIKKHNVWVEDQSRAYFMIYVWSIQMSCCVCSATWVKIHILHFDKHCSTVQLVTEVTIASIR